MFQYDKQECGVEAGLNDHWSSSLYFFFPRRDFPFDESMSSLIRVHTASERKSGEAVRTADLSSASPALMSDIVNLL